jgi:hypothetical protein
VLHLTRIACRPAGCVQSSEHTVPARRGSEWFPHRSDFHRIEALDGSRGFQFTERVSTRRGRLSQQVLKACGIQAYWERRRQNKPFGGAVPAWLADRYCAFGIYAGVDERRIEDEDNLVPRLSPILETVLDDAEFDNVLDFEIKFFSDLATQCFFRRLSELYSAAERTKETFILHIVVTRSN